MKNVIPKKLFNEFIDDQISITMTNLKYLIKNEDVELKHVIQAGTRLSVLEEIKEQFKEED